MAVLLSNYKIDVKKFITELDINITKINVENELIGEIEVIRKNFTIKIKIL